MTSELTGLCAQVIDWTRAAGVIARERLGKALVERKSDNSPVTDADHAVQASLLHAIAECCPGDAVITEETQAAPDRHALVVSARRVWIIDPIDGTRNFARGVPLFCVVVALMEHGSPVLGVIHEPMTGRVYSAVAGGGALLDGVPMRMEDRPNSPDRLIATGSGRDENLPPVVHRWLDRMVVRGIGSTAMHLALLASGGLDAVFARKCRLWDVAAGMLLVQEAGGRAVSLDGRPYFPMDLSGYRDGKMPFLAAPPRLLDELLAEFHADTRPA